MASVPPKFSSQTRQPPVPSFSENRGLHHRLLVRAKEFSCLREFRTVRIGSFPTPQERVVSLFGRFGVPLKLSSACEPKNQLGPIRRSAQCFLEVHGCLSGAVEFQQETTAEFIWGITG